MIYGNDANIISVETEKQKFNLEVHNYGKC